MLSVHYQEILHVSTVKNISVEFNTNELEEITNKLCNDFLRQRHPKTMESICQHKGPIVKETSLIN